MTVAQLPRRLILSSLLLIGCDTSDKPPNKVEVSNAVAKPLSDETRGGREGIVSYVEVNGRRLAYTERGRGQPVVLVHGGSGDMRVWDNQLEALSSGYRVIALSCRGYYPSEELHPGETITLHTFVNDLASVLRALELGPVHLVGHSSPGGFGSLLLARDHPDFLRSLVLIEPPAFPLLGVNIPPKPSQILRLMFSHPRVAMGFLKFGSTGVGPAVKAFERGDDEQGLQIFMKANLGSETFGRMPRSRFEQALKNVRPLKAQIRAGFPQFSAEDAQSIKAPTLLVSGEKSNVVIRGVTDRLEELLPHVERLNIKNASHNMFETDPEAFNRGVMVFLDKHRD